MLLLERTRDGGRKILISGGGRCNILPSTVDESRFVTDSSPHTLRRIVRSWPLHWADRISSRATPDSADGRGGVGEAVPEITKRAATSVTSCWASRARRGVQVLRQHLVTGIEPLRSRFATVEGHQQQAATADGRCCDHRHWRSLGAGHRQRRPRVAIAERLGHTVNRTYAALTPLTVQGSGCPERFFEARGRLIACHADGARGEADGHSTGGFLFTHDGYSGPAVLDVSHVAVRSRQEMDERRRGSRCAGRRSMTKHWETALRPVGAVPS